MADGIAFVGGCSTPLTYAKLLPLLSSQWLHANVRRLRLNAFLALVVQTDKQMTRFRNGIFQ
jgi:hypothetical protein